MSVQRSKKYPLTKGQRGLWEGYQYADPEMELLGFHRGRPVIYSFTDVAGPMRGPKPKRHVIGLAKNGIPFDLSENWEENFVPVEGGPSMPTVRAVVQDWLSWSIHS